MASLKFADYLQRSISLFLFGTTLFAGFITAQNVRRRVKTRSERLEQAKKERLSEGIVSRATKELQQA